MLFATTPHEMELAGETRAPYDRIRHPMPASAAMRAVLGELGETPLEAIERFISIEPMEKPLCGAREVVIEIRSASVGWVDLLMTSGQYQHALKPPYTPGMEYAGVVIERGPDVANIEIGARVIADPFLVGPRSLGAHQKWGGWAKYAVVPEAAIVPVPGDLSFDQACNLLGNYETAYHCLITRGRLRPEETVLILGATGATGLAAVEVGKIVGANVIAVGRSPKKLEVALDYGADHVVAGPFRAEVKALTSGIGVDVVYDAVGGDASLEALRCVRFGARFLIVGWASTPFVARGKGERGAPNANVLPTNLIMMKGIDVLGCPTAISSAVDPSSRAPRLAQILAWANEGKIHPHVSHVFALSDVHAAMRAKWSGEVIGGCVVHP